MFISLQLIAFLIHKITIMHELDLLYRANVFATYCVAYDSYKMVDDVLASKGQNRVIKMIQSGMKKAFFQNKSIELAQEMMELSVDELCKIDAITKEDIEKWGDRMRRMFRRDRKGVSGFVHFTNQSQIILADKEVELSFKELADKHGFDYNLLSKFSKSLNALLDKWKDDHFDTYSLPQWN